LAVSSKVPLQTKGIVLAVIVGATVGQTETQETLKVKPGAVTEPSEVNRTVKQPLAALEV
jgi:uncharacterized membrane protein YiaA